MSYRPSTTSGIPSPSRSSNVSSAWNEPSSRPPSPSKPSSWRLHAGASASAAISVNPGNNLMSRRSSAASTNARTHMNPVNDANRLSNLPPGAGADSVEAMRAVLALIVLAVTASSAAAEGGSTRADKGTLGVGIILGEPTGVSAKLYLSDDQAIQAAVGFAFVGGGLHLHADYVFHPYILQERPSFVLPFYFGPGLRVIDYRNVAANDYFAVGIRAVAGLLFDFKTVPLDAFVEGAIGIEYRFADGKGLGPIFNGAAGVRYYF